MLVSNDSGISQHEDPWEDTLAVNAGYISYWGDAKADNPYDDSANNQKIKAAFDRAAAGKREDVPPILVFRKPESGVVEFCGLCIPDHFEVRSYQDASGTQIPNYLFHFSILNTQSVPVSWLHDRARMNNNDQSPDVWQSWVETSDVAQWPIGETLDQSGRVRRYETCKTTVSNAFRTEVFDRYGHACTITGIREEGLLDLTHPPAKPTSRPGRAPRERLCLELVVPPRVRCCTVHHRYRLPYPNKPVIQSSPPFPPRNHS